ncbi:MAG TPA: VOC family protein [Gaiellaceae bacterium]|nr:VOC family protein [Gaiellaceae bacterium]
MFDHVTIRVSELESSCRFYRTVLEREPEGGTYREWDDFGIAEADADHPVTRNLHVGFAAESREEVDAFWRRGIEAGYESDGEPGLRPQYHPNYYGGFLLDPDGNSVESCTGFRDEAGGPPIDHLWLRVADVGASRRFWETVAPVLSLNVREGRQGRVHVWAGNRSFALVADGRPRSANVHLAFPVATDADVTEFHRLATDAAYRDNGPPGERPEYHAGYVGAFVLDPDGNNVEAVNHNR